MIRRLLPLLCAALLLAPATAHADGVSLLWAAPEVCPDDADVREDIERLLGRSLDTASEQPFSARGVVSSRADKWVLRLKLVTSEGIRERTVEGRSCREVTDAGALIIALAIDPNVKARSPGGQGESSTTTATQPSQRPPPAREASEASATEPSAPDASSPESGSTSTETRIGWAVGAFGTVDAQSLPAPAPGVGANVALLFPPLRIEALGAYLFEQRETLPGAEGGGDFTLTLGGLRGCYLVERGSFGTAFCAETELGVLAGKGVGISSPGDGQSLWWAAGGGIHLAWSVTPALALTAGGDALAVLSRDEFVIVGLGPVYTPPSLTARGFVGAEVRFR